MAMLEIRNVQKTFRTYAKPGLFHRPGARKVASELPVLRGVDLTVEKGDVVAILGPSGSGKTTLLNLIGGIEHPTSGSVEIDCVDICSADDETLSGIRRRKLGYIFQDFNLIPILTAEENIIMPLLLDGKKPDKTKLRELAGFLGIENHLKHLPFSSSSANAIIICDLFW